MNPTAESGAQARRVSIKTETDGKGHAVRFTLDDGEAKTVLTIQAKDQEAARAMLQALYSAGYQRGAAGETPEDIWNAETEAEATNEPPKLITPAPQTAPLEAALDEQERAAKEDSTRKAWERFEAASRTPAVEDGTAGIAERLGETRRRLHEAFGTPGQVLPPEHTIAARGHQLIGAEMYGPNEQDRPEPPDNRHNLEEVAAYIRATTAHTIAWELARRLRENPAHSEAGRLRRTDLRTMAHAIRGASVLEDVLNDNADMLDNAVGEAARAAQATGEALAQARTPAQFSREITLSSRIPIDAETAGDIREHYEAQRAAGTETGASDWPNVSHKVALRLASTETVIRMTSLAGKIMEQSRYSQDPEIEGQLRDAVWTGVLLEILATWIPAGRFLGERLPTG